MSLKQKESQKQKHNDHTISDEEIYEIDAVKLKLKRSRNLLQPIVSGSSQKNIGRLLHK